MSISHTLEEIKKEFDEKFSPIDTQHTQTMPYLPLREISRANQIKMKYKYIYGR